MAHTVTTTPFHECILYDLIPSYLLANMLVSKYLEIRLYLVHELFSWDSIFVKK